MRKLSFGIIFSLMFSCGGGAGGGGSNSGSCGSNCTSASGACSGHNGVDCAAGADSDGSVICVDGWKGSSAQYHCP